MSLPALPRTQPVLNTVHSFTPIRLGRYPQLHVRFVETDYLFDPAATIQSAEQMESGKYNHLVIPEWDGRSYEDRPLLLANDRDEVIGTIAYIEEGGIVHLKTGTDEDPTGLTVNVHARNPLAQDALEAIPGGKDWTLILDSSQPNHWARMQMMMVEMGVAYVAQIIARLGDTPDVPAITQAVVSAATDGITIESVLLEQMEKIEVDRRNGTLAPGVMGLLP